MTSFLITHPSFLEHDTGDFHPERPDRLRAILAALDDADIAHLISVSAPAASSVRTHATQPLVAAP